MKKGANALKNLLFDRAIKKRRQRAYKSEHPTVKFKFMEVINPAPIEEPKLSWWRRLLKWLHLLWSTTWFSTSWSTSSWSGWYFSSSWRHYFRTLRGKYWASCGINCSRRMEKLWCFIGWHAWYPETNNLPNALRTYLRCTRPDCRKWGKCIFFKKIWKRKSEKCSLSATVVITSISIRAITENASSVPVRHSEKAAFDNVAHWYMYEKTPWRFWLSLVQ